MQEMLDDWGFWVPTLVTLAAFAVWLVREALDPLSHEEDEDDSDR